MISTIRFGPAVAVCATKADHERIATIVNATHPGLAALKVIPGMDHHFDSGGTARSKIMISA